MTSNFNKYTKDGAIPSLMCFYNFYLWRINSILYLTRMKIMKADGKDVAVMVVFLLFLGVMLTLKVLLRGVV